jgi:hypothetical protein
LVLPTFSAEKLSVLYPKKYYENAKIHALPKKIYREGEGPPFDVGPVRYVIEVSPHRQQPRKGGRYYYPSYSVIYVTPLHDETVADFDKAYPAFGPTRAYLENY